MEKSPLHFYRYRSVRGRAAEYAEKIICQHELYFPPPSSFNDPFDCRPTFSFQASYDEKKRYYNRISKKYSSPYANRKERRTEAKDKLHHLSDPEVRDGIQAKHIKTITTTVGVLCLSEIRDDILMWSHYADSHQGLCLEFNGYCEFFAQAHQVVYKSDRPTINAFRDSPDRMLSDALLTKAQHWSYEREWRLIQYNKGPGTYRFPADSLTGIILGARMPRNSVAMVLSWIKRRATSVKLFRASEHRKKYSLVIEDLTSVELGRGDVLPRSALRSSHQTASAGSQTPGTLATCPGTNGVEQG
jgi:Protein of unknown function (DUF2971)